MRRPNCHLGFTLDYCTTSRSMSTTKGVYQEIHMYGTCIVHVDICLKESIWGAVQWWMNFAGQYTGGIAYITNVLLLVGTVTSCRDQSSFIHKAKPSEMEQSSDIPLFLYFTQSNLLIIFVVCNLHVGHCHSMSKSAATK